MLIDQLLNSLYEDIAADTGGRVADYIPELGKADPGWFGVALTTADGACYEAGDTRHGFTIQSVSKPFMYGYARREYGASEVLRRVGVEPTGEAFNSIVLDEVNNRPFNPMVNAGAIAVAALMRGTHREERDANMRTLFSSFAGRDLHVDEAVYRSESETGHRNRAIAWLMLNTGMIEGDPEDILDLYFRQCALTVTAADLSAMAATLANDGVQPITGERVLSRAEVRDVLSVMWSAGMYDYAGQWAFEVGMPAKSGVSGAVIAVIPGQMGLCAFSPPLDPYGNSVRGVEVCRRLSRELGLHLLSNRPAGQQVVRRVYSGADVRSKRQRAPSEVSLLLQEGAAVQVVELQGALFFGSMERLMREIDALPDTCRYLVLDFRRVTSADTASERLLRRLFADLAERMDGLLLAHAAAPGVPGGVARTVEQMDGTPGVSLFSEIDGALVWCEEAVLREQAALLDRTRFALNRLDLFRGLDQAQCRILEEVVHPMSFDAGQFILREGDPARSMFVVARGSVTVSLGLPGGGRKRLASIGPGLSFGEMAILDGGARSADVTADENVICYAIMVDQLREIGERHPEILNRIIGNLLADFSERLRRANAEIRTME